MTRVGALCVIGLSILALFASAGELPKGWMEAGEGHWQAVYEFRSLIKQADSGVSGRLVSKTIEGRQGAWRCVVEPGPHVGAVGMVVLADESGAEGLECILGGTGETRGFGLRGAHGKVLWLDAWAGWSSYQAYLLETVVEKGRVRVQLFDYSGTTLLSQSDWVAVEASLTDRRGRLGLMTEKGIGRFWGWGIGSTPLSGIRADAPNRLRIEPGPESPWLTVGGAWQWTDAKRERIRQTSGDERSWAFHKKIRGKHRRWSAHVKVYPKAGGAGMVFQGDASGEKGLLCWLGGRYGAGSLMLYDLSHKWAGPWSSGQDKWHYDEDLILVGETRPGHVRVQLLKGADRSVIVESPWLDWADKLTDHEGIIGFHTWKGSAEFWGFDEGTAVARTSDGQSQDFRGGWSGSGQGWAWGEDLKTKLNHDGDSAGEITNRNISGIHGQWRCRVSPGEDSTAAMLFQVSPDAKTGFAAMLKTAAGKVTPSLVELGGQTLWTGNAFRHNVGATYDVIATGMTDRVHVQVRSKDGALLAESDQHYVSDNHNTRKGHLGFRAVGKVGFSDWAFKKEQ